MRNPSRRRPLHAVVPSTVLLVSIGLLSGCMAAPAPPNTAAPVAEATGTETPPVFASNDDALAAAKAVYTRYLALSDSVESTRSNSWKEYLAMTTGVERTGLVEGRKLMEEKGWSFTGVAAFDSMTVQSSQALADSTWEIRTYLCLDLSASDTVDQAGVSVLESERPVRSPMVVVFITLDTNSQQLLISESPIWSGSNFCS